MTALNAREHVAALILAGMNPPVPGRGAEVSDQVLVERAQLAVRQADILLEVLGVHAEELEPLMPGEAELRLNAQVEQLQALVRSLRFVVDENYRNHIDAVLNGMNLKRKSGRTSSE